MHVSLKRLNRPWEIRIWAQTGALSIIQPEGHHTVTLYREQMQLIGLNIFLFVTFINTLRKTNFFHLSFAGEGELLDC